jgi:hypothetical protein
MVIPEKSLLPAADSMQSMFAWNLRPVPLFDIDFRPGKSSANPDLSALFHCLRYSPDSFTDLPVLG